MCVCVCMCVCVYNHLTVCKQMIDIKVSCLCYIVILETIQLCANKWLILNRIICIWYEYLKSFNCEQTNELHLV